MFLDLYPTKQDLIAGLIQSGVLKTPRVIDAFKHIDRKDFVPEAFYDEAYGNYPITIGQGQTISQPYTVAFMLELLNLYAGQKVLDIGSGSGWTTALIAYIVSENKKTPGKVYGIEIIPELCKFGENNCAKYNFVGFAVAEFFCKNGIEGLFDRAPFDRILCSAALDTEDIPWQWKDQLKIGGRIVVPVRNSIFVFDKVNTRDFVYQEYEGFAFVPFVK